MGSAHECRDKRTDQTVDEHLVSKQAQAVQTLSKQKMMATVLRDHKGGVDGIHGTRDHSDISWAL